MPYNRPIAAIGNGTAATERRVLPLKKGARMSPNDYRYYRNRIDTERSLAHSAARPEIADIHRQLADLYQKLFDLDLESSEEQGEVVEIAAA